jgi:hypothetical protein
MNDPDDIHRSLDAAFTARAESVSTEPPPFEQIAERGRQRTSRTLAAATIGLIAVGAAGLLAATSFGSDDPTGPGVGDALPAPNDEQYLVPTTTSDIAWACSGQLGSFDDGAITYYQSCEQQPVLTDGSFPFPTTTTATDESPTTTLHDPATTVSCTVSGCNSQQGVAVEYEIQDGDYPLLIANAHCVTLDDLLAANGWTDFNELGFPGDVMQIPPARTPCPTNATVATTTGP